MNPRVSLSQLARGFSSLLRSSFYCNAISLWSPQPSSPKPSLTPAARGNALSPPPSSHVALIPGGHVQVFTFLTSASVLSLATLQERSKIQSFSLQEHEI